MASKHKSHYLTFSSTSEGGSLLYQFFFNQTFAPCWIVDPVTLKIIQANELACKTYNTTPEEFKDRYYPELHIESERHKIVNELTLIKETGGFVRQPWHHLKKPNVKVPVRLSVLPIEFNGKPCYLIYAVERSTETTLEQSRLRFLKSVIETILFPIIITDDKGQVRCINRAACQLLDINEKQTTGQFVHKLFSLSDPITNCEVNVEETFLKGANTQSEAIFTLKRRTGEKIPVGLTHALGIIEGIKGVSHIFILRDRTVEEIALQQISRAQNLFQNIVTHLHEAILVLDSHGHVVIANQAFYNTFKTKPDLVLGHELSEIHHGAWRIPDLQSLIHLALSKGVRIQEYELKWDFPNPIGTKILKVNITPITPVESDKPYIMVAIEDITQIKQAITELYKTKSWYEKIANIISDYTFEVELTPDGRLKPIWFSKRYTDAFGALNPQGFKPEQLYPVHPEDVEIFTSHLSQCFNGNESTSEFRVMTKSGQVQYIRSVIAPVKDPNTAQVTTLLGAAQDITEQKNSELHLKHLIITLKAIRNVNQTITQVSDKKELLKSVCRTLVETKGYIASIIILTDAEGWITGVFEWGLQKKCQSPLENYIGQKVPELLLKVINSGELFISPRQARANCPVTANLEGTVIIAPLQYKGQRFGALVVSLLDEYAVNPEEHNLVSELANDIALALHNIELQEREKKAVEALQAREKQLREFFNNAAVGFYRTTPSGQILMVNPTLASMLGFASPEELMGRNVWELYPTPKLREKFLQEVERTGVLKAYENICGRKDGKAINVIESAIAVRDETGKTVYYEGVAIDITPLKKAQVEIARLASFPELLPLPVFEIEESGTIIYANPKAKELAFQLGMHDPKELLPNDYELIVKKCLQTNTPSINHRSERAGRIIAWGFYPIPKLGTTHCYGLDITEDVRLRKALEIAQRLEAVGQLAAGVAHDFNNLLTVIQMGTTAILTGENLSPDSQQMLHQVIEATERGANLTHQLLTFARRTHKQPRYLDLNDVVANLLKMLQRVIPENISINLQTTPNIPSIHADLGMIEQVITNLVTNARDAMPSGGTITISLNAENVEPDRAKAFGVEPGRYVKLSVADTGIGIPPEIHTRIFDPFFTTKEPGKGSGLGLAVVLSIVQQHGGFITFDTEVGKGTTFHIFLPASIQEKETRQLQTLEFDWNSYIGSETVLLVEDDTSVRNVAAMVLRRLGYSVYEAASGQEAIKAWNAHNGKFDMLISDLVLPGGMSGRELADQLRLQNPHLKVIYMTGYSDEVIARYFEFIPGENLLIKPFPPSKLAEVVRRTLDAI